MVDDVTVVYHVLQYDRAPLSIHGAGSTHMDRTQSRVLNVHNPPHRFLTREPGPVPPNLSALGDAGLVFLPGNKRQRVAGRCCRGEAGHNVYCPEHREEEGLGHVARRRCVHPGCKKRPSYGHSNDKRPSRCSEHKQGGMEDIVHGKCIHPGCKKGPNYGHPGDRRATFCSKHKGEGMENIVNRRCTHPGCRKVPCYGHPSERMASRCSKHREEGMENLVSRKCMHPGCKKQPNFGHLGDRRPSYCSGHKHGGMENIVSRKCIRPGCKKQPNYGRPGDRRASHCSEHKEDGMDNVTKRVRAPDVEKWVEYGPLGTGHAGPGATCNHSTADTLIPIYSTMLQNRYSVDAATCRVMCFSFD